MFKWLNGFTIGLGLCCTAIGFISTWVLFKIAFEDDEKKKVKIRPIYNRYYDNGERGE